MQLLTSLLTYQVNDLLQVVMDAGRCREGKPLGSQFRIGDACSFYSFRTSNYKLHFFESPTGIKVGCNPVCRSDLPQMHHI